MTATTHLDEGFGIVHWFNNSLVSYQTPVVQKLDSAINRINHYPTDRETNYVIQWIVIYLVEGVIHPLNNWGQLRRSLSCTFAECTLPFSPCGSILLSDHLPLASEFWVVTFWGFDCPISERLRLNILVNSFLLHYAISAHSSGFESVLSVRRFGEK